ncbi:MAG: glycogen debranching protein GlgX [Chromatiales bacterium]|jgi:glycogen operon protein
MNITQVYQTNPGVRYPPGAKPDTDGVNFSVFSRHATRVQLLLFDADNSTEPFQVIDLDPEVNRTFFVWHVYVEGLMPGIWYVWRMDGPGDTEHTGHRFDAGKHLLDPWARAVCHRLWDRKTASKPGDNGKTAMRSLVVTDDYDWEGDDPLSIRSENSVIYELHVGGFTRHPSSSVRHPGTFAALIEKIPYLQKLGITHVELMPIMAFDEQDIPVGTAELGLRNYWGYSTHSFFSPHPGYCVTPDQGTHLDEFRNLVKALHRAGIGIILDVVFNHTAEGGVDGPTINFKGMGNSSFYHLDNMDKRIYLDYTGCGNTVNCNHPIVSLFIIGCLEYWVRKMHIDGFRFDLASALSRGEDGKPMHDSPVLWGIELSDQLAPTKLIAEAWDAAGLYQVGSFPGYRWAEWNGRYRDALRCFVRGDGGMIAEMATRIGGSSDFYKPQHRLPINSINFITCHDGFTLYDLYSYNQKHNESNGEQNRDGHNDNLSYNCGVEGETDDANVLALRRQLARNAIAILLLSQGVPMLLAGDEVLNTQQGNNNCYCQDNALSWFDWTLVEKNADMLAFVRQMIALRKRHPSLRRRRFLSGEVSDAAVKPDIVWHGVTLGTPSWDDRDARLLAFTLAAVEEDESDLHVIMNMSDRTLEVEMPQVRDGGWQLIVDSSRYSDSAGDASAAKSAWKEATYPAPPRSVIVFEHL